MDRLTLIRNIESQLNVSEYRNKEREVVFNNLKYSLEAVEELSKIIMETEKIGARLDSAISSYKSERLELLELEMNKNLAEVYPDRDFKAKFSPEMFRGSEVLELLVGEGGRLAPTEMQNGRLLRQIINFSGTSMIQIMSGCNLLIMDEATNSGDGESIKAIGQLLQNLLDNGYQLIIIEHKHELYSELPRTQYNLHYNKSKSRAEVLEICQKS